MTTRTEREALRDSVKTAGREPGLSNSAIAWFVEKATPGQLQAVDQLFARELATRAANRHARPLRQARFPNTKSVDTFDYSDLRFQEGYGWDDLVGLGWLERRQDFVFHGPTGRGKTHLAIALGMPAVNAGRSVRFLPCAQLVLDLKRAQAAGRLGERCNELGKADLLVLDEFGYIPLGSDGGRLLFQVMSRCLDTPSLSATSR